MLLNQNIIITIWPIIFLERMIKSQSTCVRSKPSMAGRASDSMLIRAALEGDLVECENLLTNFGANINERGSNDTTCLHIACEQQNTKMMKFFLEHGIDVNLKEDASAGGNTPLLICLKSGFKDVYRSFLNFYTYFKISRALYSC